MHLSYCFSLLGLIHIIYHDFAQLRSIFNLIDVEAVQKVWEPKAKVRF